MASNNLAPKSGASISITDLTLAAAPLVRQTDRDRSLSRAFKARRRLGNHEGIGEFIIKPKGMRWRTFCRLMAKVNAAEDIVEHHSRLLVDMLRRRTGETLDL